MNIALGKHIGAIVPRDLVARRFMVCALALGFVYAVVNPPFAVNDEREHWLRAREITKGRLTSRSDESGPYYRIPTEYRDLILRYGNVQRKAESRVNEDELLHDLTTSSSEPPTWMRRSAGASGYDPLPYLPHLPTVWLATALHLPALWQVYLSRLSSLFCYALLTGWAVSLAGPLGWCFCVLGLMPMSLTQAAGLSADGMTNASAFLFFALLAKGAFRKEGTLSKRELVLLAALNGLLTLCKVPYFLTTVSLLALRWEPPHAQRRRWAYAAAVAIASAAMHGIWLYANRGPMTDTGSSGEQLAWIGKHPAETLHTLGVTLLTLSDDYLIELVAVRDLIHRDMRFLGAVVATSYLQLLLLVTWGASFAGRPTGRARHWAAGWLVLTAVLIVLAVFLAMFMFATPVGEPLIRGVQGRYFIPLLPALLLATSAYGRPALGRWLSRSHGNGVLVAVALINALCIAGLVARYYGSPDVDWPY